MISNAPIQDLTLGATGRFTTRWMRWFQEIVRALNGGIPFQMATYTVATLPVNPTDGLLIFVYDDANGPTTAFSSGGDWYSSQGVLVA